MDFVGDSPCSSGDSIDHASLSLPQQFIRVSKDTESTCARTELVYNPPVEEERSLAVSASKVRE